MKMKSKRIAAPSAWIKGGLPAKTRGQRSVKEIPAGRPIDVENGRHEVLTSDDELHAEERARGKAVRAFAVADAAELHEERHRFGSLVRRIAKGQLEPETADAPHADGLIGEPAGQDEEVDAAEAVGPNGHVLGHGRADLDDETPVVERLPVLLAVGSDGVWKPGDAAAERQAHRALPERGAREDPSEREVVLEAVEREAERRSPVQDELLRSRTGRWGFRIGAPRRSVGEHGDQGCDGEERRKPHEKSSLRRTLYQGKWRGPGHRPTNGRHFG